jgi:xanthine dehydrogenase YagS FAD-binding subunit
MKAVEFLEPAIIEGAIAVLSAPDASSSLIAGGSELLGELKEGTASYARLVSLAGIESLRGVERTAGGLSIGAMTTIAELENSSLLTGPYQMLAEAARSVATPEIRNQGTLGGNLCQRPRCLHFRNGLSSCLKKGGGDCPAAESPYEAYLSIFGGPNCYATNPSDLAPPLIALDATVVIEGPSGRRELPLESFYAGPDLDPRRENVLASGEVLTTVLIPERSGGWRGIYSKARERTAGDFAVVSAAVGFDLVDGLVRDARVVLGSAAPTPLRSLAAEQALEGQTPDEATAQRAAEAALVNAQPLTHNAYKVDQARALISRAVMRIAGASRT